MDECLHVCAERVADHGGWLYVSFVETGPDGSRKELHRRWDMVIRSKAVEAGDVFDARIDDENGITLGQKVGHVEEPQRSWRAPIAVSPWIRVADRLPPPGVAVLIFVPEHGDSIVAEWDDKDGMWDAIGDTYGFAVSHWMPLPEPPKE